MKTMLPLLATTLLAAQVAHADPLAETKLVCNQSGTPVLEVQFDGPRYADSFNLRSFDGGPIRKLLATSELGFRISESSLSGFLAVGTCTATPTNDTILTCTSGGLSQGAGWILSSYQFQHYRPVGRAGFNENVTVERDLKVDSLRLTVTRKRVYDSVLKRSYTAAHLKLELHGQSPFAPFALTEERTLGELVPENELSPWERCAFVK